MEDHIFEFDYDTYEYDYDSAYCSYDFITLFYADTAGPVRLCGHGSHETLSIASKVNVEFYSDSIIVEDGFTLQYSAVTGMYCKRAVH